MQLAVLQQSAALLQLALTAPQLEPGLQTPPLLQMVPAQQRPPLAQDEPCVMQLLYGLKVSGIVGSGGLVC